MAELHPDQIEAVAQVLHQRHRAGTGNLCGQCRDLAFEIAQVFGVPSLASAPARIAAPWPGSPAAQRAEAAEIDRLRAIERRARARSESYVLDRDGQIARWILNGDKG